MSRLAKWVGRFGLNAREQRTATVALLVLGGLVLFGIPLFMQISAWSRKSDCDDLRAALEAVQGARGQIRERQSKKEAILVRYRSKAPPLAGFLEQTARAQKLEVADSVDRPQTPHGKKFNERQTVIHLKKTGMGNLSRFLETIEQSNHPVTVSRLNIRKRSAEQDSFDVEVGVSAFDRVEGSGTDDKGKKP